MGHTQGNSSSLPLHHWDMTMEHISSNVLMAGRDEWIEEEMKKKISLSECDS